MMLVLAVLLLIASGGREMVRPFAIEHQPEISLSPAALPYYALRTTMRMLAALVASLLFTFTYATLAAKSRRAEMVLIPLLDVLQSVPILGYLSFTVVFFFAGSRQRARAGTGGNLCHFHQPGLEYGVQLLPVAAHVPSDLDEASRGFRLSGWQRFWRLEVPFATPGLLWNTMMSVSGGWFFVVAAEAITVGTLQINMPGVGSYVARAIQQKDLGAVGWAILAMIVTILIYDQLMFRPLVALGRQVPG